MKQVCPDRQQNGAASLLIALVLMMVTTLVTLAVARTQIVETRMMTSENWHKRLRLIAQAEWEKATTALVEDPVALSWVTDEAGGMVASRIIGDTGIEAIETTATYRKADSVSHLIDLQVVAGRKDGAGPGGRVRQALLLLTVLSPRAEAAPPLVINGCINAAAANVAIRPWHSDAADAGDALWHVDRVRCPSPDPVDLHGGRRVEIPLKNTLWEMLFSVSPEDFEYLARSDLTLPVDQRRYWQAGPADLATGWWTRSLGNPDKPVVLVFPRETGCPRFAGGVRIVGFVYIDATCPDPLTETALEITGTLVINGDANPGSGRIHLNHIQTVDDRQTRLSLPVLRSVKIPGTWKDY